MFPDPDEFPVRPPPGYEPESPVYSSEPSPYPCWGPPPPPFETGPAWMRDIDRFIWITMLVILAVLILGPFSPPVAPPDLSSPSAETVDDPDEETDGPLSWSTIALLGGGLLTWAVLGITGGLRSYLPPDRAPLARAADFPRENEIIMPFRDIGKLAVTGFTMSLLFSLAASGIGAAWPWVLLAGGFGMTDIPALYALFLWTRRGGTLAVLTRTRAERTGRRISLPAAGKLAVTAYLLLLPVSLAAAAVNLGLTGEIPQEATQQLILGWKLPGFAVVMTLYVVVVGPVAEEIIFRLVLPAWLRLWMNRAGLVALTGLLFGIIHFDFGQILPLILIGMYLSWWRERTDGLAVPCLLHMLNNGVAVAMLILSGNLDNG